MRVCIAHNEYGKFSGEEAHVEQLSRLLSSRGHEVVRFTRSSAGIEKMSFGKMRAFFSGIYSPSSRRAFAGFLARERPDVVHIHNLFPLISPSILPECREAGIPVVMTLHNYRLICPNGLLLRNGAVCRECLGGREWKCAILNCERSMPRSVGYALRTAYARRRRLFLDNVNAFICLTEFQRRIFLEQGFPPERLRVVPNFVPAAELPRAREKETESDRSVSGHVLYAGRVAPERDVPALLEAARRCPAIPFKIAGSYWRMPRLPDSRPANVEFLGEVEHGRLAALYRSARIVAMTTRCYEGFPTVILEAMAQSKPVVCADIGGLPEIVEDGVNGRLYKPGDAESLARIIASLWAEPDTCRGMGAEGRKKLEREYSEDRFYSALTATYAAAVGNAACARRQKENILGADITTATAEDCARVITHWVRGNDPVRVVNCANPHSIMTMRRDAEFAGAMKQADLLLPDGAGIVLASRILGGRIRQRITGSDIFAALNEAMSREGGCSCFLLGAAQSTLDRMRERMATDYPGVRVAGVFSPPYRTEFSREENNRMIEAVNAAGTDVLWVGMTQPKQEKWIQRNRSHLNVPVALAVGAVFDFYAGRIRRPGPMFRKMGLEWLPRLLREPRRLWRRNLDSPLFLLRVILARLKR